MIFLMSSLNLKVSKTNIFVIRISDDIWNEHYACNDVRMRSLNFYVSWIESQVQILLLTI